MTYVENMQLDLEERIKLKFLNFKNNKNNHIF